MHYRINIPNWTWAECGAGLAATLSAGNHWKEELSQTLARWEPGRTPLLLNSGRLALAMALDSLGLTGKAVAVPAYACPAVIAAVKSARCQPVPIDLLPDQFTMDLDPLATLAQNGQLAGIVAANTYGFDQDFAGLKSLGVPIVEDAAYQAGLTPTGSGRPAGMRTEAGIWSFNFKALTGLGGGVLWLGPGVATAKPVRLQRPSRLRQALKFANYALRSRLKQKLPAWLPGASRPKSAAAIGMARVSARAASASKPENSLPIAAQGMSELQARLAIGQWLRRELIFERQRGNTHILKAAVAQCPQLQWLALEGALPAVHLLPVLVCKSAGQASLERDRIRLALHTMHIQTEEPYPDWSAASGQAAAQTPAADSLRSRLLLLPCNASLEESQVRYLGDCLIRACTSGVVARARPVLEPSLR